MRLIGMRRREKDREDGMRGEKGWGVGRKSKGKEKGKGRGRKDLV